MTDRGRADAPAWSDRAQRLEDEAALGKLSVRDGQATRPEPTAAPQDDIQVENARTPAAAAAATELALERLQLFEDRRRLEPALDQGDGIGKVAAGAAMRRIEDDRGRVEQAELLIQPSDRGFDHAGGTAKAAVGAVRSDGDRVEI